MKKNLIITSGSSQLILQLAVFRKQETKFNDLFVIYNGVYRSSLDIFFSQASKLFGFHYLGMITFNMEPKPLSRKQILKNLFFIKDNQILNIEAIYPVLKDFKRVATLVTSVRVKVFSDIVLMSYLNPKKVLYTADGVIDFLPKRNFEKLRFLHLKGDLKRFPAKINIYAPYYLKNEVNRIGRYKEVSLNTVIKQAQGLKLVKEFKEKYLQKHVSYIVLSQHYHLHEKISFDADINYYANLIEYALKSSSHGVVMFKPHPRDIKEKVEFIQEKFKKRVLVVSDKFKSIPIEVFSEFFKISKTVFLTGNSTAPLFFKNTNKIKVATCSAYLHNQLNERIKLFSQMHELEITEV